MSTNSAHYEYQKRNLIFWLVFLTLIPGMILGFPLGRLVGIPQLPAIIALVWFAAALIAAIYRTTWRCPRCHQRFFRRSLYHAAFTTKCVHCGLEP